MYSISEEEKRKDFIQKMENCFQTENQSVYEHGISVWFYFQELLKILETGENPEEYKIPDWFLTYRQILRSSLLPLNIIKEYVVFHDVSKPFCRIVDENGKQHFPNHAELSGRIWREAGGNEQVARLMEMDMLIHTIKDKDIANFSQNKEWATLLVVGLSEIISNSQLFGGYNSNSFKIKFKQIDRRGKALMNFFGGKNV